MKNYILPLAGAVVTISAFLAVQSCADAGAKSDYASFVNPLVGSGANGHTFPGAVVPNGMIQPSPDTRIDGWDACSGYHYTDSLINGISHNHLSGTGCADFGDVLIMPTVGAKVLDNQIDTLQNLPYASAFSHASEIAEPGYYAVKLDRYDILAEVTSTERVALHRFTFPATDSAGMIVDMDYSIQRQKNFDMNLEAISDTEVVGSKRTSHWAGNQRIFFYAKFSRPFTFVSLSDTITSARDGSPIARCKGLLDFGKMTAGEQLLVKVGLSAVDIDGARGNAEAEMAEFDFDATRAAAREKWNSYLSKIDVPFTENREDLSKFYTALYQTAISPYLFTDADGRYLGMDGEIKQGDVENPVYTVFSIWDTFRALHPLLTIIDPALNDAYLNSLLIKAREGGVLPMWELAGNYTGCMIGYHAASLFADAVAKGQNSFDPAEALAASVRAAEYHPEGIHAGPAFVEQLMPQAKYYKNTIGYIPSDKDKESVAKALEYAYDDWCISRLAEAVGDTATAAKYAEMGKAYRKYFDPETRFMRGVMSDGSWRVPFSPSASDHRNDDYCEGTAWQWTWFVPHDVPGLIDLLGGKERFTAKLDSLFSASSEISGDLVSMDISGLLGQYAHGNEPSHHVIHLYNYAGQPWKTQALVDSIYNEFYHVAPDGLCGNEDCGQMSAWLVMNAMGFYQVAPGLPVYSIGRPMFSFLTVNLPGGKQFDVKVNNFSKKNKYIRSATLNGRPLDTPFFTHDDIVSGGTLLLDMTDTPTDWGV
ncbi:MAG: glycoside hydrolase family 92 protein [Bacteroidales bacterium]|nr:glycoside hydrolase family 92 protein [Bacteroidales bacterium]